MIQTVAIALFAPQSKSFKQQSFEVSFIEGSKLLGNSTWPVQYSHEQAHTPYSMAYFCRRCGDIWARILVHDSSTDWFIINSACRKHAVSMFDGGTFFSIFIQEDFDIPKHILAEDFLFLMTFFDKTAGSYTS